jgi:hypothetical protein
MVVAIVGAMGSQAAETLAEAEQISAAKQIIAMSRLQFQTWCDQKEASAEASFESSDEIKATCAWVDGETGEVWHAALHFDGRSSTPIQADTGLLYASTETILRLLLNEYGTTDGESAEGFPVWKVDLDGQEALLAVADYEQITLVQIKRDMLRP